VHKYFIFKQLKTEYNVHLITTNNRGTDVMLSEHQ